MTDATTQMNVIECDSTFLVKCWVQPSILRTLRAQEVTGIAKREGDDSRTDLVLDREAYLQKFFGAHVPKKEGIYNVTTWGGEVNEQGELVKLTPNSSQYQVFKNAEGVLDIRKMGYREVLEHFGQTPQAASGRVGGKERQLA